MWQNKSRVWVGKERNGLLYLCMVGALNAANKPDLLTRVLGAFKGNIPHTKGSGSFPSASRGGLEGYPFPASVMPGTASLYIYSYYFHSLLKVLSEIKPSVFGPPHTLCWCLCRTYFLLTLCPQNTSLACNLLSNSVHELISSIILGCRMESQWNRSQGFSGRFWTTQSQMLVHRQNI